MDIKTKMVNRIKRILVYVMMLSLIFGTAPMAIASGAEKATEPICALWHMYIDKENTLPTIWESLGFNCEKILVMIDFRESGEVFLYDILFSDTIGEMESEVLGSWEKKNDRYIVKLIGSDREIEAYIEQDDLFIALWGSGVYCQLSNFAAFDWYKNLVRE